MTELDKKIIDLQDRTQDTHKTYESATYGNLEAEKAYRKISSDFATANLRRSLKKYGSKDALLKARDDLYKKHHEQYGRRKGVDVEQRHIQYVRYADDFLIGIVGSHSYATQIKKDISTFLKGNLHLDLKEEMLVHRNDESVNFLGHLVKLREFRKKTSQQPKAIRAAKRNKQKSVGRFLIVDKKLARAKKYEFSANILKNVRSIVSKLNVSIDNKNKNKGVVFTLLAYKAVGMTLAKSLGVHT